MVTDAARPRPGVEQAAFVVVAASLWPVPGVRLKVRGRAFAERIEAVDTAAAVLVRVEAAVEEGGRGGKRAGDLHFWL